MRCARPRPGAVPEILATRSPLDRVPGSLDFLEHVRAAGRQQVVALRFTAPDMPLDTDLDNDELCFSLDEAGDDERFVERP